MKTKILDEMKIWDVIVYHYWVTNKADYKLILFRRTFNF